MIKNDSNATGQGFQNLPVELLNQTFEFFCQHCAEKYLASPRHDLWDWDWDQDQDQKEKTKEDRRCLINLSLTCAKWGYAAQQILHHHFGFSETTYDQQISFCRTICGNSELGRQLRVAKFRRIGTFLNVKLETWIAESLSKYSELISYPGSIFDLDSLTWEDYIAPLILLQAPNLEHAVLHGLYDWLVFNDFNVRNVTQARALPQNLKSLSLGRQHNMIWAQPEPPVEIQDTFMSVLFATFENLQMLTISNPHLYLLSKPPPLQNLRSLRLFNVAAVEEKLRLLIDGATSLEFVFWEMERAELAPRRYVTPDEIFNILSSTKLTLRKVVLHMLATPVPFANTHQLTRPETLRDLCQLTKLEELRMNPKMFCNVTELLTRNLVLSDEAFLDLLPPSLQILCIDTTIMGFHCFGAALGSCARSTYKKQPKEQTFKQLTLHIASVFPRPQFNWLNLRKPSEECLKAMRDVVSGKWEENGRLDITLDQLRWCSCTELGTDSILPSFNG